MAHLPGGILSIKYSPLFQRLFPFKSERILSRASFLPQSCTTTSTFFGKTRLWPTQITPDEAISPPTLFSKVNSARNLGEIRPLGAPWSRTITKANVHHSKRRRGCGLTAGNAGSTARAATVAGAIAPEPTEMSRNTRHRFNALISSWLFQHT